MSNVMVRFACTLFALGMLVVPVTAQQKTKDPRPLEGLQADRIQSYTTPEAYLAAHPGGALHAAGRPTGPSGLKALPGRAGLLQAGRASAGRTHFGGVEVQRAPNGTVRWMQGDLSPAGAAPAGKNATAAQLGAVAMAVFQSYAPVLRLERPSEELTPVAFEADALGYAHLRYEQTYAGLPVWGRDVYVHFAPGGNVYAINGTYEPTPRVANLKPALGSDAAREAVLADLKASGRWAPVSAATARRLGIDAVEQRLVLYPDAQGRIALAYEVTLHPNLVERYTYLIDAQTGRVLNRIARHCTLDHSDEHFAGVRVGEMEALPAAMAAGTFENATGTDLNGQQRAFRVYRHTDGVYYSIYDLPNLDLGRSALPERLFGGAIVLDARSKDLGQNVDLFHVTSGNNTWIDPVGVSAHVNQQTAYQYYHDRFGRNAIDGQDQSLISIIHVTRDGEPMDNAFWNGRVMAYGDGKDNFKPLAGALDVAGHEMTHGVVEHSANLIYQFESGALNESYADFFGMMMDPEDYLIGEDVVRGGSAIALRDMMNPGNTALRRPQPAHMSEYRTMPADQDNGGVHINSGIPNRAAALIMQALGQERTEAIYYRALTHYLTRSSGFADARNAVVQAAKDLYGEGSAEVAAATQAFDTVGITGEGGNPGGEEVPPVTGGQRLVAFVTHQGQIGYVDTDDPEAQVMLVADGEAVAHVDNMRGMRTQLSAPVSGERIWFINKDLYLAFADVKTGQVSVLDGAQIQQPGDLWNASVSRNEGYVALVSAYNNDPTLYLFDGTEMGAIPLKPESTQEGVPVETIQFPDVVSWSPDPKTPRIAFDALNAVKVGETDLRFWSLYEIDFATEKIFNILPAQPTTVSVYNITYSNTRASRFAFNYVTTTESDVVVGDYESGRLTELDLSQYQIDGTSIAWADGPSFSFDDRAFVFASPDHSALVFYDLEQGQATHYIQFEVPVYNARWFVYGGDTGTGTGRPTELPEAVTLEGNYPNPFNPSTTIRFTLPAAGAVTLAVYDALGRRVVTLVDGPMAAGTQEVRFEAGSLPSGMYLVRLEAGGVRRAHKMVLLR